MFKKLLFVLLISVSLLFSGCLSSANAEESASYVLEGNACFDEGRYQKAILYYENALEIDPKNKDAIYGKIDVYCQNRDYGQVVVCYDDLIKMDPKNDSLLCCKAFYIGAMGN
jgi:tetratricopeptide (TPR) repeat protein